MEMNDAAYSLGVTIRPSYKAKFGEQPFLICILILHLANFLIDIPGGPPNTEESNFLLWSTVILFHLAG